MLPGFEVLVSVHDGGSKDCILSSLRDSFVSYTQRGFSALCLYIIVFVLNCYILFCLRFVCCRPLSALVSFSVACLHGSLLSQHLLILDSPSFSHEFPLLLADSLSYVEICNLILALLDEFAYL